MSACGKIPCAPIGRLNWLATFAQGNILDVGAADGSVWVYYKPNEDVTLLDIDVWKYNRKIPFVRGDGHRLPFKDGAFHIVCLGDVLEHCIDPAKMLQEAKRVCRHGIVATTPDEETWAVKAPHEGYYPKGAWKTAVEDFKKDFHLSHAEMGEVTDDEKFPHLLHKRSFTLESLLALLLPLEMRTFLAHLHHQQIHFGIYLEREDGE